MDIINDGILYKHITDMLTNAPIDVNPFGPTIWTDGDRILVNTKEAADAIAGFLWAIGFDPCTGYCCPQDNIMSGKMDDHTGWYYVDVD